MRKISVLSAVFVLIVSCQQKIQQNSFYPVNTKPLAQTKFVKLPLGHVKPAGWLKDQLEIQANGLTGHLDEFWPDLIHSSWKGGEGESWERTPYYLDGLVPLAFLLEDDRLIEKADTWVEAIINSAEDNGWYGPENNTDRWPLAIASKVLMQYYEATKNPAAMNVLKGYFRYLHDNPPDWPDSTWRGVRAMENAVTGYWLYRRNGDPEILETIASIEKNSFNWAKYYHTFPWDSAAVTDHKIPLNWKADGLTAHVVNNAMAIKYPGLWYQSDPNIYFRQAVFEGWKKYDRNHGQVGGRFSGDEHLSGNTPNRGTEMCAVVESMFSLENLIEVFGEPSLADRLELLGYNSLPGTMTPDGWGHQYDQQANQVLVSDAERDWSTNGPTSNIYGLMPNYPCCLANMHQGWPKLVESMWMATQDNGLAAIIYGPSVVNAKVGKGENVKIIEETEYPFSGSVRMIIELVKESEFPIQLRIPNWAENTIVKYKDKSLQAHQGTYLVLKEVWNDRDTIDIEFPMDVRIERRYNNSASVLRGPLYFALRIGKEYKPFHVHTDRIQSIDYLGSRDWEIYPTTPWNYGLVLDESRPNKGISVKSNSIGSLPFADVGEIYYNPSENNHMKWPNEAPVVLTISCKRIPGWGMKNNSADLPPKSPVVSNEAVETLKLVPYGSARLRIAEFPVVE